MKTLSLARCHRISDAGLEVLAAGAPDLRVLNLHCANGGVTDVGLAAIAASCTELEDLDITYRTRVTDRGLLDLAVGCPRLKVLCLARCLSITAAGIGHVADRLVSTDVRPPAACSDKP